MPGRMPGQLPDYVSLGTGSRSCSEESSYLDSTIWNSFTSGDCDTRLSSLEQPTACSSRNLSGPPNGSAFDLGNILPHVLSPHVAIKTNNDNRYGGERVIWAAVEISGKLSHTYSAEALNGTAHTINSLENTLEEHQLGKFLCFLGRDWRLIGDSRPVFQTRLPPWIICQYIACRGDQSPASDWRASIPCVSRNILVIQVTLTLWKDFVLGNNYAAA